jgi:predicted AAA+ superfamily ATPase
VLQFGPRIPTEILERLWTMLAHNQGTLLNASRLAGGLSVSAPTVTSYISLLVDLLLVKSPKTYVRDSGLLHALLGIEDKHGLTTKPRRGFYNSLEDLQPARAFVVYSGAERYPLGEGIEAIGVRELAEELAGL